MKNKPVISIIIPCFNAEKYIKKCLDSILQSKYLNHEIILVDDNSNDKTKEILTKYKKSKKIKAFFLNKNSGPAKARNYGARKARGKYLLFLDIDTEIDEHCLKQVVEKFEQNKKLGAVQASLDTAGHFLTFFGFPYEVRSKQRLIFGARSAGMGIRKDLFEKIGGFDEDYFIYGEDTDLSWRVWLAGHEVHYLPEAKVYHFQKSSLNKKTGYRIFYEGAKNNTQNILKNAPATILLWMLPFHILAWLFLSLKLLGQKRGQHAISIWRGLGWNLKNLKKTLVKRKTIAGYTNPNNQCRQIMFGEINLKALFSKGWRWFWHV
ncbi:hypothetical protein COU96_02840 [Candidatus Shapirobacteria bacterium CG10_big_fil_rev_8_21_14_0_10_38_14]|uniref:Glycosyltransferase 2-like domain-containing protein n=1 Tax=Candidatus Shapirobacteria bacterium CG10_big_fil_rev_8_21_14_0_10_38_14 TaxID=1974483 RepID=A0A2M8L512_9BACT|nr:MAG: hypothetical protein COU96_02840 [Candidatus Shapirobacteria bacterium CG10_big_fil_rev_8_21_14_0_10_38_14]